VSEEGTERVRAQKRYLCPKNKEKKREREHNILVFTKVAGTLLN
jgi:hypothetical protein